MIISAIRSAFGEFAATTIDPLHPRDPAIRKIFGIGNLSTAGVRVDEDSVLGIAAFWRGLNVLSNAVAKLPANVYQRTGENGRKKDRTHAAYLLLQKRPGPGYTPFAFRQTLQSHALKFGNGFAYVFRDGGGLPTECVILDPSRTMVARTREDFGTLPSGSKVYMTHVGGQDRILLDENVLHIYGLGGDGLGGYPVIEVLSEALGGGLAAQQFGSRFFSQGANGGGLIEHPGRLTEQAADRLRKSWDKDYVGLDKSHRTKVLEEGAKFHMLTIPPEQAQFLETREFHIREVANVLNIQSHKLGDQSRKSYNSLEQSNQEFLDDDVDPWLIRWEQECGWKLLSEAEKEADSHYIEFERKALLRMDATTRATFYGKMREIGVMSANDICNAENLEPIGPDGDRRFYPGNWQPLDQAGQVVDMGAPQRGQAQSQTIETDDEEEEPTEAVSTDTEESALDDVGQWVIATARERLTKQADAKRGKPGFDAWVAGIPEEQGPPKLYRQMAAMIRELKTELLKEPEE